MTEKTTEAGTAEKRRTDENVIYVGHKPPMSYVLAVVTQFNTSSSDEVVIKARGRFDKYRGRCSRNYKEQVCYRCRTKRNKNWYGERHQ